MIFAAFQSIFSTIIVTCKPNFASEISCRKGRKKARKTRKVLEDSRKWSLNYGSRHASYFHLHAFNLSQKQKEMLKIVLMLKIWWDSYLGLACPMAPIDRLPHQSGQRTAKRSWSVQRLGTGFRSVYCKIIHPGAVVPGILPTGLLAGCSSHSQLISQIRTPPWLP